MKFMMLMIPAVYQPGKTVDPAFIPDPKKMEEMGKFNQTRETIYASHHDELSWKAEKDFARSLQDSAKYD